MNTKGPNRHTPPPPNQPVEVAVAVIYRLIETHRFALLATFRAADGPRASLWAFPGGTLEANESMHDAARREVHEELGVQLEAGAFFATATDHDPSQEREQHVRVHGFAFAATEGQLTVPSSKAPSARWIHVDRFDAYQWPPASRRLFKHFKSWFARGRTTVQPPS